MGRPTVPDPVRPILGMLARGPDVFDAALARVVGRWGQPDMVSDDLEFSFTDYYASEMGPELKRRFYSFPVQMDPAELAEVKLWTDRIEQDLARESPHDFPRVVNLDPGYLNDSKLVLASTKDHSHRIYLAEGVYAEITLTFRQGAWRPMAWTYPDYRTEAYRRFFEEARARYMRARRT